MLCKKCQAEIQDGFKFCPVCGQEVNRITACPSCNKQTQPEWVSCPFCGVSLQADKKPQGFVQDMYNQQKRHSRYDPHYDHGYRHSSGSSGRKRRRGFLGRMFSS